MKAPILKILVLLVLCIVVGLACLAIGPVQTPDPVILWQVRLPRVLLGMIVGFGLSSAGAIFQGILRNPLADPFILGTSSAATAGVMVAGIFGLTQFSSLYIMALGFALASIYLVYRIAQVNGKAPIQTIILAGVIVSLFFNAAVFVFFAIFFRDSFSVLFYLLGSLTEGNTFHIMISGAIVFVCVLGAWILSRDLNLLTQGEESAFYLGVRVERVKKWLFVMASAIVAACVAVSGMIGFIGLIIPHMMRMIIGPDHRFLIPASALGGAILLVLTDGLARTLVPPLEIPVGALTALLGAPYFIFLLRAKQNMGEF